MIKDMTEGNPAKVIFKFTLPMLLSLFFQQLYNIVDSVIAGNAIGVDALAAVGASFPITMLFIAVGTGLSVGCSVAVSQFFGAKQFDKMKTAVWTSIISFFTIGVILTVVGVIVCEPLLGLLDTPKNIFAESAVYLDIYVYGILFMLMYNTANAVFNALGDSKTPLYFLIFSSVLNVVLDLLFVSQFQWGVAGLAWATFAAQGVSSVLSFATLFLRLKRIQTTEKLKLFSGDMLKRILRVAIPSVLQQSFISVGQLFVQRIINGFGSTTVAGYTAAVKINTLAVMSMNTVSGALSSYVAQNFGASKIERIKQGFKAALIMSLSVTVAIVAVSLIFTDQLIGLFADQTANGDFLEAGRLFLWIVAPFHFAVSLKIICDGVLRGAGFMRGFMISTFTDLLARVVFSFVFAPYIGFTAICIAYPFGWVISMFIALYYYSSGKWKTAKKLTE